MQTKYKENLKALVKFKKSFSRSQFSGSASNANISEDDSDEREGNGVGIKKQIN